MRNLVRRGVSQNIAMAITGHKTASVFQRYDIIVESDVADGLAKLTAQPVAPPRKGQVRQFKKRKTA